jgi:hypothetical protein
VTDDPSGSRKEKPPAPGAKRRGPRGQPAKPDAAFDIWLDRGLSNMFGKMAEEPVPPELLALIEKSRKGS